jgi:hypothetical protein
LQLCILNRKSKHQDLGCPPHPSPPSFSYLKMFSAFCQILKLSWSILGRAICLLSEKLFIGLLRRKSKCSY